MIDFRATRRLQRGLPNEAALRLWRDAEPLDPGTVSLTILDSDEQVVAGPLATSGTASEPRVAALTAAQSADLGPLLLRWTITLGGVEQTLTTDAEVVGGVLFTIQEARASDYTRTGLGNSTTAPIERLEDLRNEITDEFEYITGVSWIERRRRFILSGTGRNTMMLPVFHPNAIVRLSRRSCGSNDWVDDSPERLAQLRFDDDGFLVDEAGCFDFGAENIDLTVDYGMREVPPALRRAALTVAAAILNPGNIPARATYMTNSDGSGYRVATADDDRQSWYGLPDVDAILNRYRRRRIGVF